MTRKIRRTREYDFNLEIKDGNFINPPRETQRNWLLNKAVTEFAGDLEALNALAARFVPGREEQKDHDWKYGDLPDEAIMEDWQIPLMQAMSAVVTETRGDVLEVGFGRGVSASYIQQGGPKSHTIIECNAAVAERYNAWRENYPQADIRLIFGRWQDVTDQLGEYDGIFFHTYPLDEDEYMQQAMQSVTFAEHFFPTAAAHLRDGGVFTYLTNEIDSLSRSHQRLLFRYFRSFSLQIVPLTLQADVNDQWWADQMAVIGAIK